MSAPSFDEVANGMSSQGIEALKKILGQSWEAMTPDERAACEHFLLTLVKARFYEMVGRDVSDFMFVLDAALLQWKATGKQVVADALKSVATEMFGFAGAFAGSAIAVLIKGAK